MDKLDLIKEKIRIANPDITDNLLDLLCEYMFIRIEEKLNDYNITAFEK